MRELNLELNSKGLIRNKESDYLEFKRAFHKPGSDQFTDTSRTFAGFANSSGGYIVFGIEDRPHKPIGVNDKWKDFDPKEITNFLQNYFAPEIKFEQKDFEMEVNGVIITFGIIQILESTFKPVICKQVDNKNKLKLNAVYKRYGAKTEEIKPEDYIILLNNEREKEKDKLMKIFEKITKAGIDNIGILNLTNGEISGQNGNFFIDETLLPQIKFINEGKFVESDGAPALKLMGNLKSINIIKREEVGKAINTPEIIRAFLEQDNSVNHIEYLKQITNETSANLPIYFFITNCGQTIEDIIKTIKEQKTNHKTAKEKLLKRFESDDKYIMGSLSSGSNASLKINKYLKLIENKSINIDKINREEWTYFLKSFSHLDKSKINNEILQILKLFFEINFEKFIKTEPDTFRKVLCHLDQLLFMSKVNLN